MSNAQFIALLLATVGTLVSGIIFLYLRGEKTHKRYNDLLNENLISSTKAMADSTNAINNNTSESKELRNLINTVNINMLEMKFNGKGKG